MKKLLQKFILDESGQAMSEYALILALIAVVVVGVVAALGDEIKGVLQDVINSLSGTETGS